MGSTEPDGKRSSSRSQSRTDGESSPGTGLMSSASRTFEVFDEQNSRMLDGSQIGTLQAEGMRKQNRGFLISSPAGSRVKTSVSPADELDSPVGAADCSSSSLELPMSLFDQEDGSSLRTSPACSVPLVDEISLSFSVRWATSGFTTSPGECWTAVTSESPNDGGVSSSLPAVLVASAHKRFSLSAKAAAGILRRAARRGRALPEVLSLALLSLARSDPTFDQDRTTAEGSLPQQP